MKKSPKFSALLIVVLIMLLLLIIYVVTKCNKPSARTDESYELPCDANQPIFVQQVPIVYVPVEPKKKGNERIPPVELIPSLVKSKIQPPWRQLCLNC